MSNVTQGFRNAVFSRLLRAQIVLKYFRIRLDQDDIKHSPGRRSGISLGIYCLGFTYIRPFLIPYFKQKKYRNYLV